MTIPNQDRERERKGQPHTFLLPCIPLYKASICNPCRPIQPHVAGRGLKHTLSLLCPASPQELFVSYPSDLLLLVFLQTKVFVFLKEGGGWGQSYASTQACHPSSWSKGKGAIGSMHGSLGVRRRQAPREGSVQAAAAAIVARAQSGGCLPAIVLLPGACVCSLSASLRASKQASLQLLIH